MKSPTRCPSPLTLVTSSLFLLTKVDALGIHRDLTSLKSSYDYIIAGGGLSGLVVANRLTEDPKGKSIHHSFHHHTTGINPTHVRKVNVLVVEFGDFDDTWNTAIPYYANTRQADSLLFAAESVVQPNLNDRTFMATSGATVGGGSTVNGMAIVRGEAEDYNLWKDLGNEGWGWDGLLPYFKKVGSVSSLRSTDMK